MEEIEAKFLNIDKEAFEQKLLSFGAQKVGDYNYKRKIYDFPDGSLDAKGAWVRLRDEGEVVTMTYKQRINNESDSLQDAGVTEIEIKVSDFETGDKLLQAMGLVQYMYKENKRTRYMLDDIEVDIDTWPLIPSYVEIEGKSWEGVRALATKLGFNWNDRILGTNGQIYGVYGIDEGSYSVFTFDEQIKR
jgi:adenylate cyclase class 2